MPSFSTTRRVRHSPEDMFALVADVEAYPHFVPLCESLVIRNRTSEPDGLPVLVATMTVAYKIVRESFTSRVTLDQPRGEIRVVYLDGPFSHLLNRWTFRPDGQGGTIVGFSIDYSFRSKMLAMLMGSMFDMAFRRFAEAFERRADLVYGVKPIAASSSMAKA